MTLAKETTCRSIFAQVHEPAALPSEYRLKWKETVLYAAIGAVVFLMVFGATPLDVTYDDWIINHYVEGDIVQHYAGWVAFRNSPWGFPLGLYERLSEGVITFSDSIPWVAIFFKLFRSILPETFQYFGIYVLACYILQAVAGGMIFRLFSQDRWISLLGVIVLTLSPIMMERAFRHTALASHWLILFSLYLFFESRYTGKVSLWYILLDVLAIGIHPYFLPMVFGILCADILYVLPARGWKRASVADALIRLAAALLLTVIAGYLIGAIGTAGSSAADEGFGYYSLNLNAFYNPISAGDISWSLFLPASQQTLGNYDGFNYLGLGMLAGLPLLIYELGTHIKSVLRQYWGLLLVCVIFFVFALSNVVTFNDIVLFEYPLPELILKIANIFRSSSRMFYPIYYLIVIGIVCCVGRLKAPAVWMALLAALQVIDLSPALITKHESFDRETIAETYAQNAWYNSETMEVIAEHTEKITAVSYIYGRDLALWALKNDIDIEISISNRSYYGEEPDYTEAWLELIADTAENTVYLTIYEEVAHALLEQMPDTREVIVYNGYYFIVETEWAVPGDRLLLTE